VNIIKSSIQNLGKYIYHTKVKPTTTYLITKSQSNQSLDFVFAMAYGCFIVSEDWVRHLTKPNLITCKIAKFYYIIVLFILFKITVTLNFGVKHN